MTALATPPKLQFLDSNGAPLVGGKLYTYAAGTTTPQVTYTDYVGGTPNANPVILDSRGEASVWLGTSLYKMALYDSTNVLIWTVDNIGGFATLAQLAASGGSNLVGFLQAGAGAVATTVQAKLRESVSVKDFGAVGDGIASDTAAIQAMFDAVASSGVKEIYFPPGTYLLPCNRTDADYTCAVVIKGLKNVVVRGAKGTKFTQNTSGTGPSEYGMFRVEECVGVTFTGFEMDGSGIVTTGTGANRSRGFLLATIDVNNKAVDLAPNQRLEFCNIYAHDIGGFILYALRDETIYNGPPRGLGLYVHDNLVERLGNDHGVGIGYMSDVVIENNRFINSLPAGVVPENMAVDLSAGIYDGIVRNNYVYGFIFGMKSETHTNKFPGGTDQRTSKRVLFENNYLEQIGSPTNFTVGVAPDAGDTYGIKLNSQGSAAVNNTIIARSISVTTGGLGIGVAALNTGNLESTALVDSNYIVSARYGVLHTDTATSTKVFTTTIRDNRINDAVLHGVNVGSNCTVEGNRIYRSGSEAVTAQVPIAQTYIRNNFAFNCASTDNPTISATVVFSQTGTGSQGYFEVVGNVIEDTRGASAADYGYFFNAYDAPKTNKIVFSPGYSAGLFTAISFDKYFSAINQTNQLNGTLVPGPRTIIASNIPSAIAPWLTMPWNVGDRAIFDVPAVGQPKAWVCTVAGTPGTWVSEGNL